MYLASDYTEPAVFSTLRVLPSKLNIFFHGTILCMKPHDQAAFTESNDQHGNWPAVAEQVKVKFMKITDAQGTRLQNLERKAHALKLDRKPCAEKRFLRIQTEASWCLTPNDYCL